MVLLQVHADGVLPIPFEGDTPGAVDVDGVAGRLAAQVVKVEARRLRASGVAAESRASRRRIVRSRRSDRIRDASFRFHKAASALLRKDRIMSGT